MYLRFNGRFGYVFVSIDDLVGCENGGVRLQGGSQPSTGYVEFCHGRRWGGLCSRPWDINGARVVCRQLSSDPESVFFCFTSLSSINTPYLDAVIIDGPKGVEDSLVFMGQVTCRGSEKYLNECIPDIMPLAGGGCSRAAISCGKSSSKKRWLRIWALLAL